MAYYISVKPFHKTKNDQTWEKILSGKFSEELDKEISAIDPELHEIDNNPQNIIDSQLIQREELLKDKKRRLSSLKHDISHLQGAIDDQNDESMREYVRLIDGKITDYFSERDYFDPRYPFHEFFSALFDIVLGIDIEKDYENTLSRVPTKSWIQLYKNIDAEAVNKAIDIGTEDNSKDAETQEYYGCLVRHIRDILRMCVETKSELKVFDELFETDQEPFGDERTKEIINTFIKK